LGDSYSTADPDYGTVSREVFLQLSLAQRAFSACPPPLVYYGLSPHGVPFKTPFDPTPETLIQILKFKSHLTTRKSITGVTAKVAATMLSKVERRRTKKRHVLEITTSWEGMKQSRAYQTPPSNDKSPEVHFNNN
jgi:hypothetical protein